MILPASFRVVLDACVLFPFTLRDTLLRAAEAGLYQAYWSEQTLDEAERNLVKQGRATSAKAARLFAIIRETFPEAMVSDHESLAAAMSNHPSDRHVVAAVVKANAQVIVTSNLRDFVPLPSGIEAQPPDLFLCNLFDLSPDLMLDLVEAQAAALRNPPVRVGELLVGLGASAPEFVALIKARGRDASLR